MRSLEQSGRVTDLENTTVAWPARKGGHKVDGLATDSVCPDLNCREESVLRSRKGRCSRWDESLSRGTEA